MKSDHPPPAATADTYFRLTEERFEKGSGLGIAQAMEEATHQKTARLRSARLDMEARLAAAEAAANAPPKKVVKKRKPQST